MKPVTEMEQRGFGGFIFKQIWTERSVFHCHKNRNLLSVYY